jgi:CRISPR/Cas system endoribonuclease Cas6 (RAMP superfamily)
MSWSEINEQAKEWVKTLSPILITIITTKAVNRNRERDGPEEEE